MLLAKTYANGTIIRQHYSTKIQESYNLLERKNVEDVDKAAAIIHTVMMIGVLKNNNHKVNEEDDKFFREYLISKIPQFYSNTLMLSNFLYALTMHDCQYKPKLRWLAKTLLDRQHPEGVWYPFTYKKENYAQAFTTMRTILALNQFKEKC